MNDMETQEKAHHAMEILTGRLNNGEAHSALTFERFVERLLNRRKCS